MKNPSGLQFAFPATHLKAALEPRKQPVQERSAATVEFLLEATLQVLRRHGYARFTTTRVAEHAGVSVGTLYQYFPNKRALVAAVIRQHVDRVVSRVCAALAAAETMPLPDAVRHVVGEFVAAKVERMEDSRALRASMAELDGVRLVRDAVRRVVAPMGAFVAARVAPGRRDDAELVTLILLAALEGPVMRAIEEQPELLAAPRFTDELVTLMLSYLEGEHTDAATGETVATRAELPINARVAS